MTPEQRYTFDATGYLYLKNVLSDEELRAAQEAVDRYINMPPEELPEGFEYLSLATFHHYSRGFAFDKALECLTTHPTTWPIINELTPNRPSLFAGNLKMDTHDRSYSAVHSVHEQMQSWTDYHQRRKSC